MTRAAAVLLALVIASPLPEATPGMTPGSVALLLLHPFDATTSERWAAALQDARPEVRAAAARAVNVHGAAPLVENVERALAGEPDLAAAEEEVLAIGALGGSRGMEAVLAAAQRLRGHVALAAAEVLVRTRGVEVLRSLPDLSALHDPGLMSFESLFWLATKGGTEGLSTAATMALEHGSDVEWKAILRCSRRSGVPMDSAVISQGLGSNAEGIRASTYWYLVLAKAQKGPLPAETSRSVGAALGAAPPDDPAGAFGREILARLTGAKPVEQTRWIAALDAKALAAGRIVEVAAAPPTVVDLLTPAEEKAVSLARFSDPKALQRRREGRRSRPRPHPNDTPSNEILRTVDRFPAGFVASVLEAAACDPRAAHGLAAAQVTYGFDGRPRDVGLFGQPPKQDPLGGPPACEKAASALFMASLAPRDHLTRPDTKEILLVMLNPPQMACLAENEDAQGSRVSGRFRAPKKIVNVEPHFPASLGSRAEVGVSLDATLSATGCVRSLTLVRGVRDFNWEVIRAVSQWRFTPALLDGKAVPVVMSVGYSYSSRVN